MPAIPTLVDLLKTGAHFGHQVSKWHPKMKPFLFGSRNGIHIINLELTVEMLKTALDAARDMVAKGGTILFVGTKRQARGIVEKYAQECKMPYITGRWLGGTFTNYAELGKLIRKLNDFRAKRDRGEFDKYTKKERVMLDREIEEMEGKVGGIATLSKLPEAVYIVDLKHEKTALAEANVKKVPVFGMTDSNVNPEQVAWGVPMNDDALKAIELMTRLMSEAVNEGHKLRETMSASAKAPADKPAADSEPEEKVRILTA